MASRLPFIIFLSALLLFNGMVLLTSYLASIGDPSAPLLYTAFAPTCHQLTSRSICLYKYPSGSLGMGDCLPSTEFSSTKAVEISYPDKIAYKLPVCSRDVAIYLGMLIGLLALPFIGKIDSEDWPSRWILVAAAVPIAIDGTTQLFGLRESDNTLRIITGAIIGVVLPFYLLPMLNSLYSFLQEKLGKKN